LVELKEKEEYFASYYYLEHDKGKWIIDAEPNATIVTTQIQPKKLEELEEGVHLFHSHMWVKGFHYISFV